MKNHLVFAANRRLTIGVTTRSIVPLHIGHASLTHHTPMIGYTLVSITNSGITAGVVTGGIMPTNKIGPTSWANGALMTNHVKVCSTNRWSASA
jgi:hypothetical protein